MTLKYATIKYTIFSRFCRYLSNLTQPRKHRNFVNFMNKVLKDRFKSKNLKFDLYRDNIAIFCRSAQDHNVLYYGMSWSDIDRVFHSDYQYPKYACSLQQYCELVKQYFYHDNAKKYKNNDTGTLIEMHDLQFVDAVSKFNGSSIEEFKIHIDLLGY